MLALWRVDQSPAMGKIKFDQAYVKFIIKIVIPPQGLARTRQTFSGTVVLLVRDVAV